MELSNAPARSLDKFIEDNLLPDTPFRQNVKEAIHIISSFLKERCFRDSCERVRVSKVVKGGSSGKGTTLRGRSDADLVVFLSSLTSFREQLERRGEFIKEIRRQLEACQREKYFKFKVKIEIQNPTFARPRALSFTLMSPTWPQEGVEFDVLPAFDALGQWSGYSKPDPNIYVKLIRECEYLEKEGEFSPCFTELQKDFLKQRPPKVKSLIRLVKCWYQQCKEKRGKPLPPQYAIELLTVYAWERGSGETDFITAEGFRTILELVLKHKQLCIFWEKYYDFKNAYISQYLRKVLIKRCRPVILDPADPTGNVAGENQVAWQRLAQEADTWLSYPCFRNRDGSAVRPWNVPTEADSSRGARRGYPFFSCEHYQEVSPPFSSHQDTYTPWEHTPQENEGWSCSIL